jgi:hypothetical protein
MNHSVILLLVKGIFSKPLLLILESAGKGLGPFIQGLVLR